MSISYDSLSKDTLSHDNEAIKKYIIICKHSKDQDEINKNKILLFRRVAFVTLKQVDNFFFLSRNFNRGIFHTKDEIVTECFLVLDRCIKGYDWKKNKTNFYFFYNKAVSRELWRLYNKRYIKHCNCVDIKEEHSNLLSCHQNNDDLLEFYYKTAEFTDKEILIVKSKLKKERRKEFVKDNKGFTNKLYQSLVNSIKQKINKLKDGENYRDFK